MKSPAVTLTAAEIPISRKEVVQGLMELSKARLSLMVVLTTAAGFYMGHQSGTPWAIKFFIAISGTALLAAGAAALNQVLEVDLDSVMKRTQDRPLVTGLFPVSFGIAFGLLVSLTGFLLLALGNNLLTAGLGLATLATYLFVYTPLKRRSVWNTIVGAIPGALPPLMGWTAATGTIDSRGGLLFWLLFAWQIPHFMAIAWMHKDDYQHAGYKMMPSIDSKGLRCGRHAVIFSFALVQVTLMMALFRMAGPVFLVASSILGLGMVFLAIRFSLSPTRSSARALFFGSIIYLPFQLIFMVFDKISSGSNF